MQLPRRTLMAFLSMAALAVPVAGHADGSETETQRLLRTHATERYNVTVPGFSIHAGGGMTAVNAPIGLVRQSVTDYGHYSDFIEHPQAIADRLVRYAKIVGRENVIAGTDCGIGSRVGHPQVGWAKFQALAEGARIATKELWGE